MYQFYTPVLVKLLWISTNYPFYPDFALRNSTFRTLIAKIVIKKDKAVMEYKPLTLSTQKAEQYSSVH